MPLRLEVVETRGAVRHGGIGEKVSKFDMRPAARRILCMFCLSRQPTVTMAAGNAELCLWIPSDARGTAGA